MNNSKPREKGDKNAGDTRVRKATTEANEACNTDVVAHLVESSGYIRAGI